MAKDSDQAISTVVIDPAVLNSAFAQVRNVKPLRICCFGSSSSLTPDKYLTAARSLGYLLARRGHTCVNGAGSFGCMAAMNDGCSYGNGHIVGVIHEMWLVDEWSTTGKLRDGGAHAVFHNHAATAEQEGPIREMLVAGGNDLQERKRLLVEGADALVVLPGGPGTWDELWEMACARNIGLTQLPIVCVNVDGYYDPFKQMLERAYRDQLTKLQPHEIVRFETSPQAAIEWVEAQADIASAEPKVQLQKRSAALRSSSVVHDPETGGSGYLRALRHSLNRLVVSTDKKNLTLIRPMVCIGLGVMVGWALASRKSRVVVTMPIG